jgi:hypothetical protein
MAWLVEIKNRAGVWEGMHPLFVSTPYIFNTKEEAETTACVFYSAAMRSPEETRRVRIREIEK